MPAEAASPVSPPDVQAPVPAGKPAVDQVSPKPAPAKDAGRGGIEHKLIQRRIREAAQALGFRSDVEKAVGKGSADVALARADISIACEITVTTTVDHEVGNVVKCLEDGFRLVAIIGRDAAKRERIRQAVVAALGGEVADRVRGFSADDFLAFLSSLPPPVPPGPPPPQVKEIKGWKVKVTGPAQQSEEEQNAGADAYLKAVWETAKKRKRPPPTRP